MKKIICITGQTASGKTKYALQRAYEENGEVINCDSRHIYQHMDIVTGKDIQNGRFHKTHNSDRYQIGYYTNTDPEYPEIKIWLYDIVPPEQLFSTYEYQICARSVISDLLKRDKTPVLVGGTYLYLGYLFSDKPKPSVTPDWNLRAKLTSKTVSQLQEILENLDPQILNTLNKSDTYNPHRLIRKIEIARAYKTGSSVNNTAANTNKNQDTEYLSIDREMHGFRFQSAISLKDTIRRRVLDRLKKGAIKETEHLLCTPYAQSSPGFQAIGYREIMQYLDGKLEYEELIELWTTKEVQYAKRQLTFMKQNKEILWHEIA